MKLAPATSTNHLYLALQPCPASKRPAWRGQELQQVLKSPVLR